MTSKGTESTSPASDPILYAIESGVATITLNRPEAKNALSPTLVDALARRLEQAQGDDDVRVIVLTNVGNTFCAGADLKSTDATTESSQQKSFVDVFRIVLDGDKPVVGRIDGHATGGGVGLVAVCDISVMRNDALIGFTEVRVGVAPAIISVVCLQKLSKADASELFLTGERISPDRAADVRLINTSVDPEDLDREVDHYLTMLMKGGPNALAASKELIRRVPTMERHDAFRWAEARSRELFHSEEAAGGIAAFRNREPAPWVPAD